MSNAVRLQFESGLAYQMEAVNAVCDLFAGHERRELPFSIRELPPDKGLALETVGYGNSLDIHPATLLANLQAVQERQGLTVDKTLTSPDFTVEMETGTGKTYVYLRTICELHERFGLSRFVIVVPSVAIKEGVTQSIRQMREHFRSLYNGLSLDSFTYEAKRVSEVSDFARQSSLKVMVCTIQAITDIENASRGKGKGATRVMYQFHEKTGGSRPIDIIRQCRPVVIVDEPQKVGKKGEINGLSNLAPLCTLRYSATPKNVLHPVYRLNAVDAARQKLVKGIEVASIEKQAASIGAYVELQRIGGEAKPVASVRLRVRDRNGHERLGVCELAKGDSLRAVSDNPAVYSEELRVLDIRREESGHSYMELNTARGPVKVYEKGSYGGDDLVREMLAATIEAHLEKAMHLNARGIKVLSLFFVDSVSNYKLFNTETGEEEWGEYARLFEELYTSITARARYHSLFAGSPPPARAVHNGYFAKSKKTKTAPAHFVDCQSEGELAKSAYELIMKDKERLLSMDEPLQFIFTHSALLEGWDNPNVFQVCILRDMKQSISRRQALGRGLRLCVDCKGARVYDTSINRLTVVATESVKDFAAKLQQEYEKEGCRFGVVTVEMVGTLRFAESDGQARVLGQDAARRIVNELHEQGLLQRDKPTAALHKALAHGRLEKPASCPDEAWPALRAHLTTQCEGGVQVHDARERRKPVVNRDVWESPLFHELWDRIKYRTTYRSRFDTKQLTEAVLRDLPGALEGLRRSTIVRMGDVKVDEGGVTSEELRTRALQETAPNSRELCDVLAYLEDATKLTRSTLATILLGLPAESLRLIYSDESSFLKTVIRLIRLHLNHIRTECLEYVPVTVGDRVYDAQKFIDDQADSYTSKIMPVTRGKCLTDSIIYDMGVERDFIESAEKCEHVKLYFKLPAWFRIPTPLGTYNPDWALVLEKDGAQNLYFVVETKGNEYLSELEAEVGVKQADKIRCGRAHFAAEVQAKTHALVPAAEYRGPIDRLEQLL